jgi:O-antigen ligase
MMQTTFSLAGPFNLGALVPMLDPEGFVARFLTATSAITIWQTIVLAIGLGVLYRRKSTGIAIGLLAAYAALVAVGVAIFSMFADRMGS